MEPDLQTRTKEITAADATPQSNGTFLCRYLCPDISKIFNGYGSIAGEACSRAQSACEASGCTSCEFFEIIEQ
jgi:poly(3-hydroxybutyrate) depolymerase